MLAYSQKLRLICLNVQNKDPKLIKAFVGTPRSEHKLLSEINKLQSGLGLINLDEPKTIEIRQLWKTMKKEDEVAIITGNSLSH
jgi:DNA sulfur modification protein DndE